MIDRLVSLHHAVILAEGWPRRLMALAAGLVAALALPPIGFFPAFALSFPLAVWLIDGTFADPSRVPLRSYRMAALDGWWFGYGYFLGGLWWIGAAFLVETDDFLWAMPFGVLGLPAILAVFHALGFLLARLVWSNGVGRLFALAFGLGGMEFVRQFVFTGFPWNTFGQGLGSSLVLAQSTSLIGTDGLTIVAVLLFATPAALLVNGRASLNTRPLRWAAIVLAMIVAFGLFRLLANGGFQALPQPGDTVAGVKLRLVQPNVSQRDKIMERDGLAALTKLFALSDRASGPSAMGIGDATHVIWPESPFPFILTRDQKAMSEIARLLPAKTTLITGAVRMEETRPRRYFNAMHAFGGRGELLSTYDKNHLVPFGEYLPFESLLSSIGLRRFVHAPGSFTEGRQRSLMELPGLPPVLPLICYEAIFPHEINAAAPRPGLIINITNDAWFGETFGPHQHFAQTRLRAIEFGLPVIRVANTGISGVIDGHGRVVGALGIGVEGILDVLLPKALPTTVYAEYGLMITLSLIVLMLLSAVSIETAVKLLRRR